MIARSTPFADGYTSRVHRQDAFARWMASDVTRSPAHGGSDRGGLARPCRAARRWSVDQTSLVHHQTLSFTLNSWSSSLRPLGELVRARRGRELGEGRDATSDGETTTCV